MGSIYKASSIFSADKGTDDIGLAGLAGIVTGAWSVAGGRWAGKAVMTDTAHGLKKGSPLVIAGTTNYNGLTRVLYVIDANRVVINKPFVAEGIAGTWSQTGGEGAWDAFTPIGADLIAANVTITFWDPNLQGGGFTSAGVSLTDFAKDVVYTFPGVIKTIQIATAGNVKLIRAASLRPFGKPATLTYLFTVTAANATAGAVYINNGQTFVVVNTIAGATSLLCTSGGGGAPQPSGILTKVSGTGDNTITYSVVAS